ncbi:MAG: SagB/ThcOx family dehydrogenase [Polyangiaceae bacterium]|nr:SagB/ThcOx family dehydrogenase [Polyangiaceae bacterium]
MRATALPLAWLAGLGLAGVAFAAIGCKEPTPGAVPSAESVTRAPAASASPLPAPRASGGMSLEEAIARRRSVRAFASAPLPEASLATLLWAAQGVTERGGSGRAAPSAGALYPLELYLATADGLFHYRPAEHALARVGGADVRPALAHAALDQRAAVEAPAVLVVVGYAARTRARYGDRAERFVALEAGHAAQNVLLEATALGLGAVPIGAVDEALGREALGLGADATPLYLLCVGAARGE